MQQDMPMRQQSSSPLMRDDDAIRLRVTDDGQGFSMLGVDSTSHFGLQLMRERVELAGGVLLVDSHPGEGTTVLARLPIDEKQTRSLTGPGRFLSPSLVIERLRRNLPTHVSSTSKG